MSRRRGTALASDESTLRSNSKSAKRRSGCGRRVRSSPRLIACPGSSPCSRSRRPTGLGPTSRGPICRSLAHVARGARRPCDHPGRGGPAARRSTSHVCRVGNGSIHSGSGLLRAACQLPRHLGASRGNVLRVAVRRRHERLACARSVPRRPTRGAAPDPCGGGRAPGGRPEHGRLLGARLPGSGTAPGRRVGPAAAGLRAVALGGHARQERHDDARRSDPRSRALGLRSADVAQRAGTTEATISRWVHGHNRPARASLHRLAAALEMPFTVVAAAAGGPA